LDFLSISSAEISAFDIAITYNQETIPSIQKFFSNFYGLLTNRSIWFREHETGFIDLALKSIINRGVCLENNLNSLGITRISSDNNDQFLPMRKVIKDIRRLTLVKKKTPSFPLTYYYQFANFDMASFEKLLLESSVGNILYQITDRSCQGQRISIPTVVKTRRVFKKNKALSILESELDAQRIIAIEYYSSILRDYDGKLKGPHTSLVVGKRFNSEKKRIEYLLRNTYDNHCLGNYKGPYDQRLECQNGYLWLPKKILKKALIDIVYIQQERAK